MFTHCVICYNEKHPSHPERSFHRFPRNEEMKNKWIEAIGLHCSSIDGMICSDHFLPEDFSEPIGCGYVPKRLLQENAVPKLKIIGLSMTDIRLQQENIKEDIEQRVVVHPLNNSDKENVYSMKENAEKNMTKPPDIDLLDFFTQSNETLSCRNENINLNFSNECAPFDCDIENLSFSYDYENIPLNIGNENLLFNFDIENIPIDCGNKNVSLNDDTENVTDPDLKRIITGKMDIIDLNQESKITVAEVNSKTPQKKKDDLEAKLKRVVIKMPDIGLRSFTEDDFTSSIAWKMFVNFILHNRKETRNLKQRNIRLQQKIKSYQKLFEILRKGGRVRFESKS